MNCPGCASLFHPRESSGGLFLGTCESCAGHWVPGFVYWKWVHRSGKPAPSATAPPPEPGPANGPVCPDCAIPMAGCHAGRGLRLDVHFCGQCGGVWLPSQSWNLIPAGKAGEEIDEIFGTLWHRAKAREQPAHPAPRPAPTSSMEGPGYNRISKRKHFYPVRDALMEYLTRYRRASDFPPIYEEMRGFESAYPLWDANGEDTLWQTVGYSPARQADLNRTLTRVYSQLKTGTPDKIEHVFIERIDYCEFGNSKPFRVRVVNEFNDNYDHFYVKVPDASRIYGLELEHTLSPNRINYLADRNTLIEEHIAGIPGAVFIREYLGRDRRFNRVRVAKEFVKFTERCFIRLLGDMRSYNYVIEMTPDFEETQFRVRAIDFDQQTYEGNPKVYLPQFFKENAAVVKLCTSLLNYPTMQQYQMEERTLITRRIQVAHPRLTAMFDCMVEEELSTPEKVAELREGLSAYHHERAFDQCRNMGELVRRNLEVALKLTI